ncbi:hypothetical protein [Roseovarius sp.]|uniref:hypothetical protein n=1 Tax=Roseovarius sp. TaxID=1486281 RepID=UPI003D12AF88
MVALVVAVLDEGIDLRVTREVNVLIVERPDLYIDLVDAVISGRSDDFSLPVEFLAFKDGMNRACRVEDVNERLPTHNFTAIQRCAAKVFCDDRVLTLSERASP